MSNLTIVLAIAAVLVFWALGAYNRMIALRAQLSQSLAQLVQACQAQCDLVQQQLAEPMAQEAAPSQWMSMDEPDTRWRKVLLAAQQLASCLQGLQTKAHVLPSHDAVHSAHAAHRILLSHWQTAASSAEDLAGAAAPTEWLEQWAHLERKVQEQQLSHTAAVSGYNSAITQFPTLILAWLFGFETTVAWEVSPAFAT